MKKLSDVKTRNELADFLGVERKKISYVLYIKTVEGFYKSFSIPKKTGGYRSINAPQGDLKYIQKKLATVLQSFHKEGLVKRKVSHGFEEGKSIITNAKIHKNKKYLLNIDIENFFDSFHFGRVRGYFEKNKHFKLSREVATIIAQITCYKGALPQGAPTSPIITNLICNILDMDILRLTKKYGIDYTRFADDLTFSTNRAYLYEHQDEFLENLIKILKKNGFKINNNKIRFQDYLQRQVVTGLTVNTRINVNKEFVKDTRAMANQLYKTGEFYINGALGSLMQLEGRFAFINQVDKYSNIYIKTRASKELNARERQYQKFLFYRYFYNPVRPVIVTEGQTDEIYLKSALKSLYKDYPELVSKSSEHTFEFKVHFFKRSKKIQRLLAISDHGADAMNNILYYYSNLQDKKVYPDYCKQFNEKYKTQPSNCVILIFDNELNRKEKPLKKFINNATKVMQKKDIEGLEKGEPLYITGNLFAVTHPLKDGDQEGEIEDLFHQSTLEMDIGGKKFSRDSNDSKNIHVGKAYFAKYIKDNYQSIDFSNFKPMLDAISQIVKGEIPSK